ncbi:hypothetical protein ABIF86_000320 [Bradyrhizobium japonicum]
MFVVIVETQIDAEERAGSAAYLAKLILDDGEAVEEELGIEVLKCENRRALAMLARPNDVFLAWRWWQMNNDDSGGQVLFTVDVYGNVIPLDENEADALLVEGVAPVGVMGGRRAPPVNVFCRPASLSGQSILRGQL